MSTIPEVPKNYNPKTYESYFLEHLLAAEREAPERADLLASKLVETGWWPDAVTELGYIRAKAERERLRHRLLRLRSRVADQRWLIRNALYPDSNEDLLRLGD
jgi:hypothetical protein